MPGPLVSVVINNHDYAHLLPEAIDSALGQTHPDVEVVVVDDGSTDDSRAVLARYGDRVRAVLQPNGGQASAFNAGFAASRGDLVCLLDADDVSHPTRAERLVAAFAAWPRADWIRHRLAVVDAARRPLGAAVPDLRRAGPTPPSPVAFLEGRVPALTSGLAFRRRAGDRVFPLPRSVEIDGRSISLARDADAYLRARLAAVGAWYGTLDDVLGEYRRHGAQQYVDRGDVVRMLRRQIEVAESLPAAFRDVLRGDVVPSTVFKHRAVVAALEGAPFWSAARVGPALRGWRRALRLLRAEPRLAARQSAALAFALLMPRRWLDRVLRSEGFPPDAPVAASRRPPYSGA